MKSTNHKDRKAVHPWDHARSSALAHGGEPTEYAPIHDWFDRSKSQIAFFTHRALRHHQEGIEELVRRVGATMTNSVGAEVCIRQLGRQHLLEDTHRQPVAADWLDLLSVPEWMPTVTPTADEIAEQEARRLGIDPGDMAPLCNWFMATRSWFGDARHLAMRHHAFGIFEAEEVFGMTVTTASGQMPTRYLAERHVRRVLQRIPSAVDWLRKIKGKPWMADAEKPRRIGTPAWGDTTAAG